MSSRKATLLFSFLSVSLLSACGLYERAGVGLLAKRARFPEAQVQRNVPYDVEGGFERSLDVYVSTAPNAPVLIFVHGGGWNEGDKDLRRGSLDVYGNIGRYYAARGVTTLVVNYRLQPKVTWREQAEDVAETVAWAKRNISKFGGDPERIFLMGHSAGAHLAAMVALNQGLQEAAGLAPCDVDGLISVSGAALDLTDEQTYKTEDPRYYEKRFGPKSDKEEWAAASPASHADSADPSTLILYAGGESVGLQRQSDIFKATLERAGVNVRGLKVKGENHARMVLVLSHPKKAAAPAVFHFIQDTRCPSSLPTQPDNVPR